MDFSLSGKRVAEMLTVSEVAQMLHVHPTTVRRWERQGLLKSHRLGPKRNVRFKDEDVSAFVNAAGADAVSSPNTR